MFTGKTQGQVAIRWCLQKDIVPSVVLGARTVEQLEQNVVAAKGWILSPDQVCCVAVSSCYILKRITPYRIHVHVLLFLAWLSL